MHVHRTFRWFGFLIGCIMILIGVFFYYLPVCVLMVFRELSSLLHRICIPGL